MPVVNYPGREITAKLVYAGPARSGKTSNLQYIHQRMPPDRRGKMVSLATHGDRTLFFDFLPLDLGQVSGFSTRFQLYTVPGQVYYRSTRRLVLQGADGIVFVADSQRCQLEENLESLRDLHEALVAHGIDPRGFPIVLQYSKQDLPSEMVLSAAALDEALNFRRAPSFEADILSGRGVFETLRCLSELVLRRLSSPTALAS